MNIRIWVVGVLAVAGLLLMPRCGMTGDEYTIGVDDVLSVAVLQPEKIDSRVTVAPDGSITFAYIGTAQARGLTLNQLKLSLEEKLGNGFMRYPLVAVTLLESKSRKFFVYGEVMKAGTYILEENTTVLKAISMAGGLNKFGSASRVKVLRPKMNKPGYDSLNVNIKAVFDGDPNADLILQSGDIIVVSEGVF